jgi:hypothetical protein
MVLIAYNPSGEAVNFSVAAGGKAFNYSLRAGEAGTFKWGGKDADRK